MRSLAQTLVAALIAVPFVVPVGAAAQVRVAVDDFAGARAARVRNAVVEVLQEEGVELISRDEISSAAEAMELEPRTATDYGRVAVEIEADAIVTGQVSRRGRRLSVTVYSSGGEEIGSAVFNGRNASALQRSVQRGLWADVGTALEDSADNESSGAEGATAVVVRDFEGAGAAQVRARVVAALQGQGIDLVPNGDAETIASELGVDLDSDAGRAAVAQRLSVSAFVTGETSRRRRRLAEVRVFDGQSGGSLGQATFSGRTRARLFSDVEGRFWDELGDAVQEGIAPQPLEVAGSDADDEVHPSGGPRPSPLTLRLSQRVFTRSWDYKQDLFGALREYGLGFLSGEAGIGPMLAVDLHWYPFAHFSGGAVANIGLEGHVATSFSFIKTKDSIGREFPSSSTAWWVGGRYRIPFGSAVLTPRVAYGSHTFRIEAIDADNPAPDIPDVDYGYLRIGTEFSLQVIPDAIRIESFASYLMLLSTGQLEDPDWFPHASGGGLEIGGAVAFQLMDSLEVLLGVDYTRYFFSLNPDPEDAGVVGDQRIAGGARDHYLTFSLGLGFNWPGQERADEAVSDEESDADE